MSNFSCYLRSLTVYLRLSRTPVYTVYPGHFAVNARLWEPCACTTTRIAHKTLTTQVARAFVLFCIFLGVGAGMIADDVIPGSEGVSFVFPCCIQFGAVQGPRVLVAPASDPKISTACCRLWASTILTTSLPTSYNLRSPCRHRRSRTQLQPSLPPHPSLSDRSSSMPDP